MRRSGRAYWLLSSRGDYQLRSGWWYYYWGLLTLFFLKFTVHVLSHSVVSNSLQPHGLYVAHRATMSMEFSKQEYWNGLACLPPGDLPNPEINPGLLHCRWILYHLSHQRCPRVHSNFSEALSEFIVQEWGMPYGSNGGFRVLWNDWYERACLQLECRLWHCIPAMLCAACGNPCASVSFSVKWEWKYWYRPHNAMRFKWMDVMTSELCLTHDCK